MGAQPVGTFPQLRVDLLSPADVDPVPAIGTTLPCGNHWHIDDVDDLWD